ncbi:hypothetical protein, partial [Burkholderia gladioli]|uniref:hypothetical protein n=2 Tax=Burkholderia gladioli TaxID=28095 RepID=UPI001ABA51E9
MTNTIDSTGDGDLSLFALRRNRHGATGAGSAVDRSTGLNFTRLPAQLRCADWISFLAAEKTKPPLPRATGVVMKGSLTITYFHTGNPHYHRRGVVSRSCS